MILPVNTADLKCNIGKKSLAIQGLPTHHTDHMNVKLASYNLVTVVRNQEGVDVIASYY